MKAKLPRFTTLLVVGVSFFLLALAPVVQAQKKGSENVPATAEVSEDTNLNKLLGDGLRPSPNRVGFSLYDPRITEDCVALRVNRIDKKRGRFQFRTVKATEECLMEPVRSLTLDFSNTGTGFDVNQDGTAELVEAAVYAWVFTKNVFSPTGETEGASVTIKIPSVIRDDAGNVIQVVPSDLAWQLEYVNNVQVTVIASDVRAIIASGTSADAELCEVVEGGGKRKNKKCESRGIVNLPFEIRVTRLR